MFGIIPECCSASFGNSVRLRRNPQQAAVQVNFSKIEAVGSVLNGESTTDFLEFRGVGLPGYSGGPVVDTSGQIVGVVREAWVKSGISGGQGALMNRAFSGDVVSVIEQKLKRFPQSAKVGSLAK